MNNLYFYSYFLFIRFAEKIKKDLPDSSFTGMALLSTVLLFNVISVVFYLAGSLFTKGTAIMLGISSTLIVLVVNYFVLYKNHEKIVSYYVKRYQDKKHNTLVIFIIVGYVILSCIICARLAYLVRNHLL